MGRVLKESEAIEKKHAEKTHLTLAKLGGEAYKHRPFALSLAFAFALAASVSGPWTLESWTVELSRSRWLTLESAHASGGTFNPGPARWTVRSTLCD
ncbi:MAG: hypothetical protein EBS01_01960 [Verrucomicrobia bacterium]|nr:hypothetical protein [Verrucomicrobiota bacterium]